ncbi:MAG: hypothetical protein ACOC6G_01590, partial [Thermoproteota archaeon]
MNNSLTPGDNVEKPDPIYLNRELRIIISLTAFTVLILPFSSLILRHNPPQDKKSKKPGITLKDWQILAIWGTMGLVLLLPMFLVGALLPFPPMLFGNSFAWWLMITGITGLLIIQYVIRKYTSTKMNLKSTLTPSFALPNIKLAIVLFALMYSTIHIIETILLIDLRIVVIPLFKALTTPKRVLAFLSFIPFYLTYFFTEGLYLHHFRKSSHH